MNVNMYRIDVCPNIIMLVVWVYFASSHISKRLKNCDFFGFEEKISSDTP